MMIYHDEWLEKMTYRYPSSSYKVIKKFSDEYIH